jgi:hypothetical protein
MECDSCLIVVKKANVKENLVKTPILKAFDFFKFGSYCVGNVIVGKKLV